MNELERQRRNAERKRKRKKKILIIEIAILAVLAVALVIAVWATQKLSLVNRREVDESLLKTADEYNTQQQITEESDVVPTEVPASITPVAAVTEAPAYVAEQSEGMDIIALVGLDTRLTADDGENSDTMILCCIDHNQKTIKLVSLYRDTLLNLGEYYDGTQDYYAKANEAYNIGGPTQFLSMVNLNLDLNVKEYITIDFRALAYAIDILGGLDVDMTRQELIHMNNYNVETSQVCDVEYEEVEVPDDVSFDGARTRTFHLTGTQAVSYARIRYTDGGDYRRASRQREILQLFKEKAKSADLGTIDSLLNTVLPYVTTNLDNGKLISMATNLMSYTMVESEQPGFPAVRQEDDGSITGIDCIIPVTLEYNVALLHKDIFGDTGYYPSNTVRRYSEVIVQKTGFGAEDIESTANIDYHEEKGQWSEEAEAQAAAAAAAAENEEEYSEEYDPEYYDDGSEEQYYEEEAGGEEYSGDEEYSGGEENAGGSEEGYQESQEIGA